MAEMKKRREQSGHEERGAKRRACDEELRRWHGDQLEPRADLGRIQRKKQALPRADQRGQENDRERGMHELRAGFRTRDSGSTARRYQDVTSSSAGEETAGFGSWPSILSGLSTRSSSSRWMRIW